MPFQHRFLSVLAPFWRAKMAPKSIKNRSKLSFQAFLFPHRFLHRFFLPTSTHWISKKYVFPKEKQWVFKKTPFEDNIDFGFYFGANLPPCWPPKSKIFRNYGIPRGLQNLIFFRIVFLWFWVRLGLQHWAILGAKTAPNSKNWVQKMLAVDF